MKRFFYFFAPLAILLAGCSKEYTESPIEVPDNGELVFTASFEKDVDTKTVLYPSNSKSVVWSGNESIDIFDIEGVRTKFSTKDSGKSATFTLAPNEENPAGSDIWYALYPYDSEAECEDGVFSTVLKNEYTVTNAGSFDDETNIAVAKTTDDSKEFSFKNVLSWLKVAYEGLENVTKIEFRGNNGEIVAGDIEIDYSGSDDPVATITGNGSDVMTVNSSSFVESPSSPSDARVFFYIPVLPGVFEKGFTLTFIAENGVSRTYAVDSKMTFKRNIPKSMHAKLTSNVYKRVESLEDVDEVSTDDRFLLVYPSGSEYRVFSFQKTMENIVAEANRLEDVHTLEELKDQATTIYQNALKSNYILASSTDNGATITIDKQEEEETVALTVSGGFERAMTSLSATVESKSFTLGLENITVELKDNNAALISAVLNGQDVVDMSTALRGHELTLTIDNCIDYVGAKFGMNDTKLAMAKTIFLELCELVGEYTGKPFDVDLNTTVTKFYAQYWDNIRDYSMLYAPDKKWGSIYPVGFYNADDGFTFNVPAPNKVWFYDFEESTSRDIDYFETYWTNMGTYHNFPFPLIAQKLAAKLRARPDAFDVIKSINFASIGDTYQRYVDRFNDSLEDVYIYKLVRQQ